MNYFGRTMKKKTENKDIRKRLSAYINDLADKYEISKEELIELENAPETLMGDNENEILELKKFIITYEELMNLSISERQLVLIKQAYSYQEAQEILDLPNRSLSTLSVLVCNAKKKLRTRVLERCRKELGI